jgi:hypothetical protein
VPVVVIDYIQKMVGAGMFSLKRVGELSGRLKRANLIL